MREYIEAYYPKEELAFSQNNLDMFFNFMNERHNIWHRRFIEKLPREQWTDDPILKVTKYTNIYRELDRGTLWWLEHVGNPYLEAVKMTEYNPVTFRALLWKTIIYRLCNRVETFEECGFPAIDTYNKVLVDGEKYHNEYWQKLENIRARGESVMTSAHLTCPTPGGYTKVEGFIMAINSLHGLLDNLCKEIPQCKTSKDVFDTLCQVHCVGNFTGYEVLCDLMYVKAIPFAEDDWANVGPGAYQGIRLIYPSSAVGAGKKRSVYRRMVQLRDEQHEHFKRLGIQFKFYEKFTQGHLSLRSIEHSLCEFSKYWLQKHNLGKQRMIFDPNSHKSVIKDGDKLVIEQKI